MRKKVHKQMNTRTLFARQLHAELPVWLAHGWVTEIAAQYPQDAHDGRQGWQVLLSILAALCVGGGIIALFAAN